MVPNIEHRTLAETFSNILTDYLRLFNRLISHILFHFIKNSIPLTILLLAVLNYLSYL